MISPHYIRDYLEQKFKGNYRISANGREFMIPSIFSPSNDLKMSINLDTGLWQCFRSHNTGNFYQLMVEVEGITFKQAEIKCTIKSFSYANTPKPVEIQKTNTLSVESEFNPNDLVSIVFWSGYAPKYLEARGLLDIACKDDWSYCIGGKYQGRIIIPYRKDGEMIFFQARAIGEAFPKYKTPPSDKYIKSSSVLYPFDWSEDYVIVVEGPIDAISLQEMGYNATCIQGSFCSIVQLEQLREFGGEIIMSFDNDAAGNEGMSKMDFIRKKLCMPSLSVIRVPIRFNDWNDILCSKTPLSTIFPQGILAKAESYGTLTNLAKELNDFES